jgi:hypothetical protein
MILGRDKFRALGLRILNSGESTKIWSWRSPRRRNILETPQWFA